MNTTSLFVELIVIGIGAGLWITLIVFAIFGYAWIPENEIIALAAAMPLLTFIYLLGIVSDRVIDKLFGLIWGGKIRSKYFDSTAEYFEARRIIFTHSDRMADMYEYSRSRLRICRGWAVHSILIAVMIPIFACKWLPDYYELVSITGISIFCFLGASSYFAWWYLSNTQYLSIREQAKFLSNKEI